MNTPSKPKDPPAPASAPPKDGGVPDGMEDEEAKGTPHDDRHATETANKG